MGRYRLFLAVVKNAVLRKRDEYCDGAEVVEGLKGLKEKDL